VIGPSRQVIRVGDDDDVERGRRPRGSRRGTGDATRLPDGDNSSSQRSTATLLGFALVVGCWLMVWFFTELHALLAETVRADLAHRLAVIGAAAVMIGGSVELGPTMVQNNSDNAAFVGIPVAHTFTQAGAGAVIVGLFTFAVSVLLHGLEFRLAPTFPRWLSTVSIVVAVLLIGSFFVAPGFLLPIWTIVVGQERPRLGPRRGLRSGSPRSGRREVAAWRRASEARRVAHDRRSAPCTRRSPTGGRRNAETAASSRLLERRTSRERLRHALRVSAVRRRLRSGRSGGHAPLTSSRRRLARALGPHRCPRKRFVPLPQ
jgi:hypothetical protein